MSANDLFRNGGGGGNFPKADELEGKLILLKPSVIESVPRPQEFGGGMQDRVSADTVVFEDDGSWEVHEDMYWSQAGIVGPCRKALKPNSDKPFVLGRLSKVPSKIGKEQGFDTPEKIEKGLQDWLKKGGKGAKPNFAWGLLDFSDEDVALAMKYVNSTSPIASGADEG